MDKPTHLGAWPHLKTQTQTCKTQLCNFRQYLRTVQHLLLLISILSLLSWPEALVKVIITRSPLIPRTSVASQSLTASLITSDSTTETAAAATIAAAAAAASPSSQRHSGMASGDQDSKTAANVAESSPGRRSRTRSQSLIDASSIIDFSRANKVIRCVLLTSQSVIHTSIVFSLQLVLTDHTMKHFALLVSTQRLSIVSDLHSATSYAWSGISQVSTGFTQVIKYLPQQIYASSASGAAVGPGVIAA